MAKRKTKTQGQGLAARLAELPEDFQAFNQIYEQDIQPALAEKELERQQAWGKAKKFILFGVLAAIIAGGGLFFFLKSVFAVIPGVVIGVGIVIFRFNDLNKVRAQAKQLMIQPVASEFGITYNEKPSEAAESNLGKLRQLGLLPSWDRKTLQDEMIGERNGVPFEFFEAHLEDKRTTTDSDGKSRTEWVTVFRGQCWVFNSPKTFHGTTKVTRDSGIFNALGGLGSKYNRIRLEDPVFEKKFEVYGTDQVEARFLLTPNVMQAILDLETAFDGGRMRCAFDENLIFAACEGGDLFEAGSMFKSFDDPDRVGDLLEDFAAMFHLIDVLGEK